MPQLSNEKYQTSGNRNYTFAEYPSAKIYKEATGGSWRQHLIFGDYITILDLEIENNRVKVRSRNTEGWMNTKDLQPERVLEVNFVDIGQGDGCHIVTPDDQQILVDAGKTDNMIRYLFWRFYLYNKENPLPFPFKVIVTHADDDHYGGFEYIFEESRIPISKIYHNGLVQRPGEENEFGKVEDGFITTLVDTSDDMKAIINNPAKRTGTNSKYPKVLHEVLTNNPNVVFKRLARKDVYIENFADGNVVNEKPFTMELLGPVTEEINGQEVLKYITDQGKTKNGHSVIFKLVYGKVRILLGGDLNEEAGEMLVDYYKNNGSIVEVDNKNILEVDVAKACHHGSNHFYYDFVKFLNSPVTVISSGDNESYSHPRPDTIGALGKCGFGNSPLVFSTELARSNKEITRGSLEEIAENNKKLKELKEELKTLEESNDPSGDNVQKIADVKKKITEVNIKINSFLTKYGMINVRTDGNKMIIAQKLERKATYGKWDIHKMEYSQDEKRFVSK